MLTKTDLEQVGKVIRKIIREEVETEVSDAKNTLKSQITLSKIEIKHEIRELDDRIKNLEIRVDGSEKNVNLIVGQLDKIDKRLLGIEAGVKDIKKRVRKTEKTIDKAIGMLDTDIVVVRKRVSKIEDHLNL